MVYDQANRTIVSFVESVTSAKVLSKVKYPASDMELESLEACIKTFLGAENWLEEILKFISRFREFLLGRPILCDNLIIVEAPREKASSIDLDGVSAVVRKASRRKPVFIVVVNADLTQINDANLLFNNWDSVLVASDGPQAERMANLRSMLNAYRRGYGAYLNSLRNKAFWRIVDVIIVMLLLPILLGFFSGLGEGVGQSYFNYSFPGEPTIDEPNPTMFKPFPRSPVAEKPIKAQAK